MPDHPRTRGVYPDAVAVGYADEFDALTGSSREQTLRTAIGPGTVMARG